MAGICKSELGVRHVHLQVAARQRTAQLEE